MLRRPEFASCDYRRVGRNLFDILASTLLPIAFPRKGFLGAALFAWLQVKRMTLYLFDNVFLLYLPLEAAQSAFKSFPVLHEYFSQSYSPRNRG